ncbi:MAG: glutamate--tRNA ligase [Candidatus Bipolaricaulota bacterium]|nr:glutamate--tRNA ligase [Candidatus Bipolaricaulota bacterium]MDW8030398.1 glutamate--tRNA ligase [Candidatus Bipolaricaulota bacterium]
MTVRVRFAPSPTGELHVGGARTALFNWLFARKHKGVFILRFEDTDIERNRPELIEPILESLRWLGLLWDEGPYFQSQRFALYREWAAKLLHEKKAYKCYCTPEELEAKRQAALAAKLKPKYDGRCRNLTPQEEQEFLQAGRKPAVRLKIPDSGTIVVEDAIRGRVEFDFSELDDFIILRSDGRPTYNFAVVVDDITMGITHVIRADEHLNNTPKQILLYQAFGHPLPIFAHVPMVLAKDRSKLSKRHGATAVFEFRDRGILPEALVNYLARLGWSHGDQEIFTREELIENFSLDAVHPSAAIFDEEKLFWVNQHYLKTSDPKRLGELLRSFLVKLNILSESEAQAVPSEKLTQMVVLFRERAKTLSELAEPARYLLTDHFTYDPEAVQKFLTPDKTELLRGLAEALASVERFVASELERATRAYLESQGKALKDLAQPCRVALTGRTTGAGLFETMELMGKDRVIARLRRAGALAS